MFDVQQSTSVSEWIAHLDVSPRARIVTRIRRIQTTGNFGDHKYVDGGVWELRIDFGPGYRLYFAKRGESVILLLVAGDKSSQAADIRRAKAMVKELGQ